ncbi:unnamed protein product, partial [Porites lobata]
MIADRLKLNDDKTEFMIIGTRAQLDKVNVSEIVVGQAKVPALTIVRNLGTWLDTNLTISDGEMLLEDYSARSKKTLGDRTFKVAAPRIWNILPKDIR